MGEPIEIENRLMEHPSVREAAVVAIDIEHMSRIKAVVILAEEGVSRDEDLDAELQAWCKSGLQRHQFPMSSNTSMISRTATGRSSASDCGEAVG